MPNNQMPKSFIIDQDNLPDRFPTHLHSPNFWEALGRATATYGFLEETLGKAIFAITATTEYNQDTIHSELEKWLPKLEKALSDTLNPLINAFGNAVRENPLTTIENLDELLDDLRKAANLRNVLCHGSWQKPDSSGKSLPYFVNRQLEKFDTPVDASFLSTTRKNTTELACAVVNVVTHMGYQFPGSNGPGQAIR